MSCGWARTLSNDWVAQAGAAHTPEVSLSGVVIAGDASLRLARRFSFWSTDKFPTRRRAIPWEISLRNVKGHESGARRALVMGNGGDSGS
jgi:hypothetical protein